MAVLGLLRHPGAPGWPPDRAGPVLPPPRLARRCGRQGRKRQPVPRPTVHLAAGENRPVACSTADIYSHAIRGKDHAAAQCWDDIMQRARWEAEKSKTVN